MRSCANFAQRGDPCTGESSQEFALDQLCSQNDNEANLNDPEVLKNFVLKWKAKRAERVRDAADCSICDNAIENYEATYGVNLNEEQEAYILNNMTTCWRLSEFNCLTNKALFFQRPDIQQIIADNSLIDPCNPDLTTKDILDNYANNNCRDNICTKPLDGIFGDIVNSWDINTLINCMEANDGFDIDDAVEENINDCEQVLIDQYKIQAIKIYFNRKKATEMTKKLFGFNGTNDCSDAFRHAFFNALNVKSIGRALADQFAYAHECNNPRNRNDVQMDFHNNYVGMDLVYHNYLSDDEIAKKICNKINLGELKMLENPDDNNSKLIQTYGCKCNE